jgi:hypothetical protein
MSSLFLPNAAFMRMLWNRVAFYRADANISAFALCSSREKWAPRTGMTPPVIASPYSQHRDGRRTRGSEVSHRALRQVIG